MDCHCHRHNLRGTLYGNYATILSLCLSYRFALEIQSIFYFKEKEIKTNRSLERMRKYAFRRPVFAMYELSKIKSSFLGTPLFIFVCADTTRMAEGQGKELWIQDLSAISENILLAAHAMGLGACWTTIYPIQKKVNGISRTLNLPGNLIPLNGIIIGYPDEPEQPKDKWDTKKITYGIPK